MLSQLSSGSSGKACPDRIGPGRPANVGQSDGGLAAGQTAGEAGPDGVGDVEDLSGILAQSRFHPRLDIRRSEERD